jgi:anti-anti-sigma regulatory factor
MARAKKSPRKARSAGHLAQQAVAAQPAQAGTSEPEPATLGAVATKFPGAVTPANVLQLGTSLSIREVSECASRLKAMLANGPTMVDASLLVSIDTAGIQMLLAAAASAQRRGFKLKLLSALGVRTGAARALGLHEHLGELVEILP